MGDPVKRGKTYSRPRKPWDRVRLEAEQKLKKTYGLKKKRELWKSHSILRKKRQSARKVLAMPVEKAQQRQKELIQSLNRTGVLGANAGIDNVLGLETHELLERRLQTMVMRKGLAGSMKQARQFIVHGHIGVNGKKVTAPSYLVRMADTVSYYGKPMVLEAPPKREIKKEDFEASKPQEEILESAEEKTESLKAEMDSKETTPGQEGN